MKLHKALVDSFSLSPQGCKTIVEGNGKDYEIVFASQELEDMFCRKLKCAEEGNEFLPEYYEFAKQLNIPLDDFRNSNFIQKDYGFKDQRGEVSIDYVLEDGKYIKQLN